MSDEAKKAKERVAITGRLTRVNISSDIVELLIKKLEVDRTSKTGLRWKNVTINKLRLRGKEAGSFNDKGYFVVQIAFNKVFYRLNVSNIVWIIANNKPIEKGKVLNHKNRIRSDNRIENLELTTVAGNMVNRKTWVSSGYKNVYFIKRRNNFFTQFKWLGNAYTTKESKTAGYALMLGWELSTSGKVPLDFIRSQSDEWKDGTYLNKALAECKKQGIAVTPPKFKTLYEYIASVEGSC